MCCVVGRFRRIARSRFGNEVYRSAVQPSISGRKVRVIRLTRPAAVALMDSATATARTPMPTVMYETTMSLRWCLGRWTPNTRRQITTASTATRTWLDMIRLHSSGVCERLSRAEPRAPRAEGDALCAPIVRAPIGLRQPCGTAPDRRLSEAGPRQGVSGARSRVGTAPGRRSIRPSVPARRRGADARDRRTRPREASRPVPQRITRQLMVFGTSARASNQPDSAATTSVTA